MTTIIVFEKYLYIFYVQHFYNKNYLKTHKKTITKQLRQ